MVHARTSSRARRAWTVLLLVGSASCVTNTVYQRAVALQAEGVPPATVLAGLADPNWKLRYLATQACGRGSDDGCLATTGKLITTDHSAQVRAGALSAAVTRCRSGGAKALMVVAAATDTRADVPNGQGEIIRAMAECPSADAVLALVQRNEEPAAVDAMLATLHLKREPPGPVERQQWLGEVAKLPEPRDATEIAIAAARALMERQVAERQREAEYQAALEAVREKERRERQQKEALNTLDAARRALQAGEVMEARTQYRTAEAMGATDTLFSARLGAAVTAEAKRKIAAAWAATKKGDLDAASEAAAAAGELGVNDDKLDAAMKRLEERLDAAEARRREVDEEKTALASLNEIARDRCSAMYEALVENEGAVSVINEVFSSSGSQLSWSQAREVLAAMADRRLFLSNCRQRVLNAPRSCTPQIRNSIRPLNRLPLTTCYEIRAQQAVASVGFALCAQRAVTETVRIICMTAATRAGAAVLDRYD